MTAAHLEPSSSHGARPVGALLVAGAAAATVAALALPDAGWARAVVATLLAITLVVVAWRNRTAAVLATAGFLASLGALRRLVSMVQADPADDPLLLVAPVVAVVLALLALRDGATRDRTPLTYGVAVFAAVTVVAVLNPILPLLDQVKGTLFWTVPLLWFPVGRLLDADGVRRVLHLVAALGVGACATGVFQATVRFPAWDQRWIDERGYLALNIDGPDNLRPFGWSASAGEFALTAAIVAVLCGLLLADGIARRRPAMIAASTTGVAIAAAALALSAVRTAVLLGLVAAVVVAVAHRRASLGRVLGGLTLAVLVLVGGVRALDVESWQGRGFTANLRRSLVGLASPFDPEKSTLRAHIDLTEGAFRTLDDRPLGGGPGFGTTGSPDGGPTERERAEAESAGPPAPEADDEASTQRRSAENDLGNALLAFGVPGGALVLIVTVLGLRSAWRGVCVRPDLITLGILGILVASLRFWWTGGHYAPAMLVWLVLGWSDRPR